MKKKGGKYVKIRAKKEIESLCVNGVHDTNAARRQLDCGSLCTGLNIQVMLKGFSVNRRGNQNMKYLNAFYSSANRSAAFTLVKEDYEVKLSRAAYST